MHINNTRTIKRPKIIFIIGFLPSLFSVLLIFAFDSISIAVLTLCAAVLHELGHLTASLLIHKNVNLNGVFFGLRINIKELLSYREEIFVSSAGAGINLLTALAIFLLGKSSEYLMFFGIINLMTGLSNLMPIKSFDGYRILKAILNLKYDIDFTDKLTNKISFSVLTLLSFFSLYLISKLNTGYVIFFIFFTYLVKNINQTL